MQFSELFSLISLISLFSVAFAHMEMSDPAPFRSKKNPNSNPNTVDFSMTSPLSTSSGLMCKGYQTDFADPKLGKATGTFAQGSNQKATIIGGAAHDGRSCQISLSPDGVSNFVVIKSIMGKCVGPDGFQIPFTVPADAPTGRQVLSWSWIPHSSGTGEFYQNCAAVDITAGSGPAPAAAYSSRPAMFVANIGNGCTTKGSSDPRYPSPGPDSTGTGDEGSVIGTCGASTGAAPPAGKAPEVDPSSLVIIPVPSPTSASSVSVGDSVSTTSKFSFASTTAAPPLPALATVTLATSSPASPTSAASPDASGGSTPVASSSVPLSTGALEISTDGTCKTKKCPGTSCCSSASFCGSSPLHCGVGCQSAFGSCSGNSTIKARGLSGRVPWN